MMEKQRRRAVVRKHRVRPDASEQRGHILHAQEFQLQVLGSILENHL